jgi:hypothetical protein
LDCAKAGALATNAASRSRDVRMFSISGSEEFAVVTFVDRGDDCESGQREEPAGQRGDPGAHASFDERLGIASSQG